MNYALNFVSDCISNQTGQRSFKSKLQTKLKRKSKYQKTKDKRGIARHKNFQEVRSFQK